MIQENYSKQEIYRKEKACTEIVKREKKDYSLCIIHVDVLVRDELVLTVYHNKRLYTQKKSSQSK